MGILNDEERIVHFYIDREFLDEPALLGIHPNDNTATVWIGTAETTSRCFIFLAPIFETLL